LTSSHRHYIELRQMDCFFAWRTRLSALIKKVPLTRIIHEQPTFLQASRI